jgi:hypothetical protein
MDKDPSDLTDAAWREMWERVRPQLREADRVAAPLFWRQMEQLAEEKQEQPARSEGEE